MGEQGYVVVYRLDTATGEIETFLASSPQFVEERLGRQTASMLRGFFDSMTFTPGAKLAPKATR